MSPRPYLSTPGSVKSSTSSNAKSVQQARDQVQARLVGVPVVKCVGCMTSCTGAHVRREAAKSSDMQVELVQSRLLLQQYMQENDSLINI